MAVTTIGIVGGMSPESTILYYRTIVRSHVEAYGNHAYPRMVIASVSFQQYATWQHAGEWDRIGNALAAEFRAVAAAGADFAILATNTMHKVLPQIDSPIPVLSILDAVGEEASARGIARVGLTGTRFTMSDGFYARALEDRGLTVVLPSAEEQETIHRIIYEELIVGDIRPASRAVFEGISAGLVERGAEAILLGCTELELLAGDAKLGAPALPTTDIHARFAWEVACGKRALPGVGRR